MDKRAYTTLPTSGNLQIPHSGALLRSKFMAFLEAVLEVPIALGTTSESIGSAFDVNNAAGKQLDVIGELVGLPRVLPYAPATGTREMSDEEYRLALMIKIAQNEWDGTNGNAVEIVHKYLSGNITVSFADMQNGTVEYNVTGDITTREVEILHAAGLLLVPVGVSTTVTAELGDVEDLETFVSCGVSGMEIADTVIMS